MKILYILGRGLQIFALILMPSAIWVGEFRRDESGAIFIFVGSAILFFIGWFCLRFARKS